MDHRALDRWITREPPDGGDADLVTCETEGCAGADGLLLTALAWTLTGEREVAIGRCDGLNDAMRREGFQSACGETDDHEPHEETAPERTFTGTCPCCGDPIVRVEGPW